MQCDEDRGMEGIMGGIPASHHCRLLSLSHNQNQPERMTYGRQEGMPARAMGTAATGPPARHHDHSGWVMDYSCWI
jgi:hypothetical protein